MRCQNCVQTPEYCVCGQVDEFFVENGALTEDLDEQEARLKPGAKRSLCCWNFHCTCKKSLRKKAGKV